ncbi:MAG: hypothetical protein M3Y07_09675 [Acidobacteriota bacterium]|nr:hypothetical protein [Acidobacteriota bacterium]
MTRSIGKFDIAVLVLAGIGFFSVFRTAPSVAPYVYDESDYMSAASRGLVANFLDKPSLSLIGFLRVGLGTGIDRAKRTNLSEYIRSTKDITFLRHFHGPIYFYWLATLAPLVHADEYWMRFSGLILQFATFVIIYIGALSLVGRTAALISSFLFLFSPSELGAFTQLSAHVPYVLFAVLTLILFASGRFYLAVAAFAFAFCSIEYAILLPIACICGARTRACGVPTHGDTAFRSVGLFLLTVLILWPMGILKLSALKSYFYISYLALLRKGSFGTQSPPAIWFQRLQASPLEYSLAILSVLLVILYLRKLPGKRLLVPCLVYATLMFLTTLKNTSLNPTYISSILPALALVTGTIMAQILDKFPKALRMALLAALLIVIVSEGYRRLPPPYAPNPGRSRLLASIRQAGIAQSSALVPYDLLPTLSYYFPSMDIHAYLPSDNLTAILEKFRSGGYRNLVYSGSEQNGVFTMLDGRFFRAETDPLVAQMTLSQ